MGDQNLPVLSYHVAPSGWTDALTEFHEETAGGGDHPIDLASRNHTLAELTRHLASRSGVPTILEIGCSSGFMVMDIRRAFPHALVIGADYVKGPLQKLGSAIPELPLLHFDLVSCPLPDASVDAVVLLNVLEHIEDDAAAARQVHRILKPGGFAVVEVPAGPALYDVYDKVLMHFRRYSLASAIRLLERADFRVLRRSHLGFFVYPPFWLVKRRNKRFLALDPIAQQRVVAENIQGTQSNRLFDPLMRFETWLGRWVSYPVGVRCLLTCRKQ